MGNSAGSPMATPYFVIGQVGPMSPPNHNMDGKFSLIYVKGEEDQETESSTNDVHREVNGMRNMQSSKGRNS